MKKKNVLIAIVALLSVGMIISSCNKDQASVDNSAASDDSFAEALFDNVNDVANEAYAIATGSFKSSDDGIRLFLGECTTITLDTIGFPLTMTIDFGDVNCLCNDGRYRRGAIVISFTGRYRHAGTVITHGFVDYFVNDNQVDGTSVLTNMGFNTDGHLTYSIEVVGVIHRANNGGTLSWNSSRTREWIEGANTGNRMDDVYLITGTADGITTYGSTWSREVITPLRKELSCKYIVSGTFQMVPQDRPVRIIDFGTGECDNIITVLVNGETYTIYLP